MVCLKRRLIKHNCHGPYNLPSWPFVNIESRVSVQLRFSAAVYIRGRLQVSSNHIHASSQISIIAADLYSAFRVSDCSDGQLSTYPFCSEDLHCILSFKAGNPLNSIYLIHLILHSSSAHGTTVLLGQGTAVAGHCYLCRSIDSGSCPRSCPQSMVEAGVDHRIHSPCLCENLSSEGCAT